MQHILDECYKGHELVFYSQKDGFVAVDIRLDDYDGAFIGGYCDMLSVTDARNKATGFVDGWETMREQ